MNMRAIALATVLLFAAGTGLADVLPGSAAFSEARRSSGRNDSIGLESGGSPDVVVVPLPPAAWTGLGSLGLIVGMGVVRRRRNAAA